MRGDYALEDEPLADGRGRRLTVRAGGRPVSRAEAVALWRTDARFRRVFADALRDDPHEAFFFETPPLAPETEELPFEFALLDAPSLARVPPDPRPFRAHFAGGAPVATFANLGGDAVLVAPAPVSDEACYAHLAATVRSAPAEQVDALWVAVGRAADERRRRSRAPFWVSTSGLGVFWTHVRIDDRPKYYTHAPYRV